KGPKAVGPYAPGLKVNGVVYLSGQLPTDPQTGELIAGDMQAMTDRVIENLKHVLEAANLSLADVVKTTVFLKDMNDYAAMNEAYGRNFGAHPPARSAVQVARLPRDARIEIEAIAVDGETKYPFTK
ncbi:MAG TPA: RidA family protein, partial [Bryobacteraceae bacterium]|nr:RidA family protein [Bryobacteraceae bacterium]